MVKLRPASTYRKIKRAYTRKSKYKKKSFVRGIPGCKVVLYDVGNKNKKFQYTLTLKLKTSINLRHNAIESARITATRHIEKVLGKLGFHIKVRVVPHHVLRENTMATGAGADRFQQGMSQSFGKPIGLAARVLAGKPVFEAYVDEAGIPAAKEALVKASKKLPTRCSIEVTKNE